MKASDQKVGYPLKVVLIRGKGMTLLYGKFRSCTEVTLVTYHVPRWSSLKHYQQHGVALRQRIFME